MDTRLSELPTEIIQNIVLHAIDTSPRTSLSLKLSNKVLSEAVNVVCNRHRTIRINADGTIICRSENHVLTEFESVHHITVRLVNSVIKNISDFSSIIELIETARNLKTLTWNAGYIPVNVLSALGKTHPNCALRVFEWRRFDEDLDDLHESELALADFPTLTHLRYAAKRYHHWGHNGYHSPYAWPALQQIAASSRSLELASFVCNFAIEPEAGRDWKGQMSNREHESNGISLKSLTIDCPSYSLSLSQLRQITKFINLSNLESLKFSQGRPQLDYFQNAATLLPNLKHISLNLSHSADEDLLESAGQYLRTCSPVRTLSVWGWTALITVPAIVNRHGQTLEVLQLHEREDDDFSESTRSVMSLSDIKLLRNSCPHLTDLTFDLNSEDEKYDIDMQPKNIEFLESLTHGQPQLQRVQIYANSNALHQTLKDRIPDDFGSMFTRFSGLANPLQEEKRCIQLRRKVIEPIVEPYSKAIWKILYGQYTTGERLLEVKFGNWESRKSNNSLDMMEESRTHCDLRPHERDDHVGECAIKTRLWAGFNPKGV